MIDSIFWVIPASSVVALLFAYYFYKDMMSYSEGTDLMKKIAQHVRVGAMAYLKQQYKVVSIVFIFLACFFAFLAYGLKIQNPFVPFAFLTGGFFSGLAGYFGMKTATYASARAAHAANQSLNRGLVVAFRSGAVMGLTVVGLALLDISAWFVILNWIYPAADTLDGSNLNIITTTTLRLAWEHPHRLFLHALVAVFSPKQLMLVPTLLGKLKQVFPRMILVILPQLLIM